MNSATRRFNLYLRVTPERSSVCGCSWIHFPKRSAGQLPGEFLALSSTRHGGGRLSNRLPAPLWFLSLVLCAALTGGGCASTKPKIQPTVLRVHAEAASSGAFTRKIKVFQTSPVEMVVDESPLLTEMDVEKASVVDALGGHALAIKFNQRGRWLLDSHTSLNMGRHFAVFVQYGDKPVKAQWLAAPIITRRISDGVLLFTPDAAHEDVEAISKGLGEKPAKKKKDENW
jgi:hypothetical protein